MTKFVPSPRGFVPEDSELYLEHVDYYFDTQLASNIMALSEHDKDRMYEMLTEYADVFSKAFGPKIPLVEHILGHPWPPEDIAKDPTKQHLVFGPLVGSPFIDDYDVWKEKRDREKAAGN